MSREISLPFNWSLRDYQKPLWKALLTKKRAIYVWHRRAGKDILALNKIVCSAIFGHVGTYWHVFPNYSQGKKAIWQESTIDGRPYLDFIPKVLIKSKNEQELKVTFYNNSVYQIVGSDNVDALRGAGVKGVVFSEYAEQRPTAWEVIQPMIMATNGWAMFNFTPKGQNHAYELFEMAKNDPSWYAEILTVENTMPQVFTKEQIEQVKQEYIARGKSLDLFNQEYYCSFHNAIEGSYYSQQLKQAETENRIGNIPYEPAMPVSTWWDLGVNDTTAIWFTQIVGKEIRIIDYHEDSGFGLNHYIKIVKEKPYIYESHNAPHDIRVREFTNGKSRLETAYELGISFDLVPNIPVEDGINATRMILGKCWFDKSKCQRGLLALRNYKKQFDELKNTFKNKPLHDWSSNGADAFRYLSIGIGNRMASSSQEPEVAIFKTQWR